jgi:hypothetical protein
MTSKEEQQEKDGPDQLTREKWLGIDLEGDHKGDGKHEYSDCNIDTEKVSIAEVDSTIDKAVEEEEDIQLNLDTSMVPRITLKLNDCDYDLFRSIAIEELNYRTILPGDVI